MNEDVLAAFLWQTFIPFVAPISGFVVTITVFSILIIMHSWALPSPEKPQEK